MSTTSSPTLCDTAGSSSTKCTTSSPHFVVWAPVSTAEHDDRLRIYKDTRGVSKAVTDQFIILSVRGFEREYPPTSKTTPALRQRRNSVDVLPISWDPSAVLDRESVQVSDFSDGMSFKYLCREMDEPVQFESTEFFPDYHRYPELHRQIWYHYTEENEGKFLELSTGSISNRDFVTIIRPGSGDGWFSDDVLNVALESLSLRRSCAKYGIVIAQPTTTFLFLGPGQYGDVDNNNYADLAEYKKLFGDAKYIFLPINDGYTDLTAGAQAAHGMHWALLAIDRKNMTAHYVDSLFVDNPGWQTLADTIAKGVGRTLGESYTLYIEYESPHQNVHNSYAGQDFGPCGPFIVRMIDFYTRFIIRMHDLGEAYQITLQLNQDFKRRFAKHFNSWSVRAMIAEDLVRLKVKQEAMRCAAYHDNILLANRSDVERLDMDEILGVIKEFESEPLPLVSEDEPQPMTAFEVQAQYEGYTHWLSNGYAGSSGYGIEVVVKKEDLDTIKETLKMEKKMETIYEAIKAENEVEEESKADL